MAEREKDILVKITENNVGDYIPKDNLFKTEKAMCNYFEKNIKKFCECVLNEKYVEHKREFYFQYMPFASGNKLRADFMLKTNKHKYILEFKNTSSAGTEINKALGQILCYINESEKHNCKCDKYILIVNKISFSLIETIQRFNLPVDVCIVCKDSTLLWKYGDKKLRKDFTK